MENNNIDYASIRREYLGASLDLVDLMANPVGQFERWFANAVEAGVIEPNAMSLSTVDASGRPSTRIVLFKGLTDGKLSFFTNYTSLKASEIAGNPKVAVMFFWAELARQVRIRGAAAKLSREESDAYFQSRPRYSKIAAWASAQSRVLKNRKELEDNFEKFLREFEGEEAIPTPPNWGGYTIEAEEWEFWQGRENRMHDRFRYRLNSDKVFVVERLNP
ncbi:MAG: pyridoxamine 5'-phosphate oxidase [Saprospirales bacterium]|nr:MAG: pyridoxamine 5'-phosphate oxidase [Saprospirales bacterium]